MIGSRRLRNVVRRVRGTGFPPDEQGIAEGDLPFFKVGDFNLPGNERILQRCTNWIQLSTASRLRAETVPPGSLLFPKIGAALLGNARRLTSQQAVFDNNVLGLVPGGISATFLYYWMSTIDLRLFANPGPVPSLNESALIDIRLPISSIAEQRAIADFLDAETARIDALITMRRRMIALLVSRRQAWLGKLFDDSGGRYRLKRLLAQSPCYGVLVPNFADEGVPFIRVNDIADLDARAHSLVHINPNQSREYKRTVVQIGDILLSVVGSIDKVAMAGPGVAGANVARAVARIVPCFDVPSELLVQWFGTSQYLDQARLATQSDTAQPTLNMGDLANFEVSFPAPDGRLAILERSRKVIQLHNAVASLIGRQIQLLREHRQALITAAVTGEMDVPGVRR